MSAEHEEDVERRKEDFALNIKLSRIESVLDNIKEQILNQFESIDKWQDLRDKECDKLEESIVQLRIEQAMQGVKVGAVSVLGATIMSTVVAAIVAYFIKK